MEATVREARQLRGRVRAPSDKSISHRGVILNALADGEATIENFLVGSDCLNSLRALRAVGVPSTRQGTTVRLRGRGLAGFRESANILNAGTSATTVRFMSGLLASDPNLTVFTGAPSLRARPMTRISEPLTAMGATVLTRAGGTPPLVIKGGRLRGIEYSLHVASSEVKTCLILAGLRADGRTVIHSPLRTRDHTEQMLRAMGASIASEEDGLVTVVEPLSRPLSPFSMRVPGEISAAVYWLVVGSVHPDADILIEDVGMNQHRTGLIDVLCAMGADITMLNERVDGLEPVADVRVRSARLRGTTIEPETVPRMIDEFPGFVLAAALAEGETVIRGAADLRSKKSNRIGKVALEYARLGADVTETADGLHIRGVRRLRGARCSAHGDHRLANSLAVAGLVAEGETSIDGAEAITKVSYPSFWSDLKRVVA
jgi:3-phosphoshikimate 1-carboxyvinyltransferase